MDEMLAADAEYGPTVLSPYVESSIGLGVPMRMQTPNGPETFMSRVIREVIAVIPQFLEQGKIRAEATKIRAISDNAHAVSELSFELRKCIEHGDTETANLLRKSLNHVVEKLDEPVETNEDQAVSAAMSGLREVLKDESNGMAFGMLAGLGNATVQGVL